MTCRCRDSRLVWHWWFYPSPQRLSSLPPCNTFPQVLYSGIHVQIPAKRKTISKKTQLLGNLRVVGLGHIHLNLQGLITSEVRHALMEFIRFASTLSSRVFRNAHTLSLARSASKLWQRWRQQIAKTLLRYSFSPSNVWVEWRKKGCELCVEMFCSIKVSFNSWFLNPVL